MSDPINLTEILGRERDDYGASRIVQFEEVADGLEICEQCDGFFATVLDQEDIRRLAAWLTDWADRRPLR